MPLFEHITPVTPGTAPLCAESTPVASSAHATPLGHSPGSVEGVRGGEEKVGSVRSWKEVCLVTGRRHIIAPTDHATAHERRTERAVAAGIPHILLLDTLMALAP